MANTYMSQTEIKAELNRLLLVKASLEYDILTFALGGVVFKPLTEIDEELFFIEKEIKDARFRLR